MSFNRKERETLILPCVVTVIYGRIKKVLYGQLLFARDGAQYVKIHATLSMRRSLRHIYGNARHDMCTKQLIWGTIKANAKYELYKPRIAINADLLNVINTACPSRYKLIIRLM